MSNHYAPLPNNPTSQRDLNDELEAAFDDSDEEATFESHPLNPVSTSHPPTPGVITHVPGTYDFNANYDYPPPGSPPRPSTVALPNDHGNSNGITSFTVDSTAHTRRNGWFGRTAAAILPTYYVQRLGLSQRAPSGAVGGGGNMDGVFANVTAKPTRPVRIQDGDDTYLVPEDSRAEAPPSYASAQADSVPPYWETTVHAPFSPDSLGEVMFDGLNTGSLFSFLWNMLVSISFQFIGFLLTYLLHTTHAARLGSRAGLGVTLIQYGFTLRAKMEGSKDDAASTATDEWPGWRIGDPAPTEDDYYKGLNASIPNPGAGGNTPYINSAGITTTEWLSFFLMTVGWFILLTSLLSFWRVKRWERGILSPQRPAAPRTTEEFARDQAVVSNIEEVFGLSILSRSDLRAGLGFGSRARDSEREYIVHEADAAGRMDDDEREPMMPAAEGDWREREVQAADMRLREALQASGLL